VPERFETSQGLLVRPVVASEIGRFDALLDEHHWLGRGLVGETLRHVAVIDDEWIGLVGYGSPALTCSARDRWIGWSPAVRYRRLRFVANNQRFCILPAGRYPNVASAVLGASLRRLAADWEVAWGHRVVLVETFTDPQIHPGTCYQATNFKVIGETSGWRRNKGSFVHHGRIKHVWVHPLHRVAASILSSTFDHPIIAANPRRSPVIDCNTLDFDSDIGLLARLFELPEHRMARGIRHSTASVIAVAVVAVLSGARSFTAIGEVAGELPQEVLARLGAKFHPIRKRYVAPSEPTIRRHLQAVDADALDRVVGSWLEGEPGHGNKDDRLVGIAVDGKALRGARQDDDKRTFLFAGMLHETGAVIAQTEVDGKTNEIKAMRPLFDRRESLAGTVVTADAMHAQRDHADFIVDERGGDYLLGVKSNQPKLADALDALDALPGGSFSP
jgi:hypothetical protein